LQAGRQALLGRHWSFRQVALISTEFLQFGSAALTCPALADFEVRMKVERKMMRISGSEQ